jgi:hypothetical protein
VPKATGGPELPKLTYAGGYGAGDKLLAIQAGVYTDDIDAVVFDHAIWIAAGGLLGLLVAGLVAFNRTVDCKSCAGTLVAKMVADVAMARRGYAFFSPTLKCPT